MIKRWFSRRKPAQLQVLMICMGNLCRSPMAEAVLRGKLLKAGLAEQVLVDSAGTHGFKRGTPADPRAVSQAALRGYQVKGLKSRPVVDADFNGFDLVLAMDSGNLATLYERCPVGERHRLGLLLSYAAPTPAGSASQEVPDPYFGGVAGFDRALDLIEPACDGLLVALQQRLR